MTLLRDSAESSGCLRQWRREIVRRLFAPTFPGVVADARIASQLGELASWCLGADARASAASELRRLGLPAHADHIDDVCQDVLLAVLRRIEGRGAICDEHGRSAVIPYARRSLSHAAIDLVRLGSAARLEALLDPSLLVDVAAPVDGPGVHDDLQEIYVRSVRHAIHRQSSVLARHRAEWAVAAALVAVTAADHPGLALRAGTPQPDPRSPGVGAAGRWAGLAYAGRVDCFEQPETGAVRERRSTALRRVDGILRNAAEQARLLEDGR